MNVPLLDLKAQYQGIKNEVLAAAEEIFERQQFILGPRVEKLEKEIAQYCRSRFAVGVSSGSDALLICLMADGIGPGDRVLTTPYTFFATAGAIARTGATPVFADIEEDTYNLSPADVKRVMEELDEAERSSVKALIPVHLYGQCAEMEPLLAIARQYKMTVIEDAAQAIGAEYRGNRAGAMGDFGCFSFFPSKNLGAFGDGGIVTVQSEALYERLRILRGHGAHPKYVHHLVGGNFRLDALQAAIVSIKLPHLDRWTEARRHNARRYRRLFAEAGLEDRIRLPVDRQDRHIYNQFVIAVDSGRDELRQVLAEAGVGSEVYYPIPLHLQECFSYLGYKPGQFPVAEKAALHTLALPVYPELSESQQHYVVETIGRYMGKGG
ncbi:MAG: DegT/DnrJ/EryC1/StrS family aminotransferase [Desulfobacterales bacterium]|nr:DegT/DnrJ/EryC1/StrS family aminotransferase [Desulfobacterales bacterium]